MWVVGGASESVMMRYMGGRGKSTPKRVMSTTPL